MTIKPASAVYSILKGTGKLRLLNKLNKHCSFRQGLLIDRACAALFKPVTRSRGKY